MKNVRMPGFIGRSPLVALVLAPLLLAINVAPSAAGPVPPGPMAARTIPLPAAAVPAIAAAPRSLAHPKLDSAMKALADAGAVSDDRARGRAAEVGVRVNAGRVHVQIVVDPANLRRVTQAVVNARGEVTGAGNDNSLIQGWLPPRALKGIAMLREVQRVQRVPEVFTLETAAVGAHTTEGLAVINGNAWHTAGQRGAGVKIGVMDVGFTGYTSLLGTDLPASVTAKNFVDGETDAQVNGTTEHGTACAEIIYDIAPNATIYLAKVGSNLDIEEAATWLRAQGVDLISSSIGTYNVTPGDGSGYFNDIVSAARSAGVLWMTAASNDREAHWGGLYADANANGYHEFGSGVEVNHFGPDAANAYAIPAGYVFQVAMRWDNWSAPVDQDYDLYLLRLNDARTAWDVIGTSEDVQDGAAGQTPTEYGFAVTSGATTAYGWAVIKYSPRGQSTSRCSCRSSFHRRSEYTRAA